MLSCALPQPTAPTTCRDHDVDFDFNYDDYSFEYEFDAEDIRAAKDPDFDPFGAENVLLSVSLRAWMAHKICMRGVSKGGENR